MILDTLQNQKLATYYKGNEISNSLKSIIHVIPAQYKIQLPDKVWKLIKEFMIYGTDECILATKFYQSKEPYIIHRGKFFTLPNVFNNSTLTKLWLNENQITDITALGNALNTNSTLIRLYLSDNQITDITALSNALNTNYTLTVLVLGSNQITDITALGNALNTNSTLTYLDIYDNQITDITALGNALNTNSTLTTLELSLNQITDNDKDILRQAWGDRNGLYL